MVSLIVIIIVFDGKRARAKDETVSADSMIDYCVSETERVPEESVPLGKQSVN